MMPVDGQMRFLLSGWSRCLGGEFLCCIMLLSEESNISQALGQQRRYRRKKCSFVTHLLMTSKHPVKRQVNESNGFPSLRYDKHDAYMVDLG